MDIKSLQFQKEEQYLANQPEEFNRQPSKFYVKRNEKLIYLYPKEYWDFNIELEDNKKNKLKCSIVSDKGKRFDKLSINNEKISRGIKKKISKEKFFC